MGTAENGVFGLKHSLHRGLNKWIEAFRNELELPNDWTRTEVWNAVFPECKHIFMTRRNKLRLAVSWWKAIASGEWHRMHGQKPSDTDIDGKYSFEAIRHLLLECNMREAAMQSFFDEGNLSPLTIVYEDFILDYEGTVRRVLEYLGISNLNVSTPPALERLADNVTENWVQRFRQEIQEGWSNPGW